MAIENEVAHQFACQWIKTNLLSSDVPSGIKNALRKAREPEAFLSLVDNEALEVWYACTCKRN